MATMARVRRWQSVLAMGVIACPAVAFAQTTDTAPAASRSIELPHQAIGFGGSLMLDTGTTPPGAADPSRGGVAPVIWADAAFRASAKILMAVDLDISLGYTTELYPERYHQEQNRRDVGIHALVGFAPERTGKSQFVLVAGGGFVFASRATRSTDPPTAFSPAKRSVDPALLGGLDVLAPLGPRRNLVTRLRTGYVIRSEAERYSGHGSFMASAGIGVQFW